MKKETLIKHLADLPALHREWWDYRSRPDSDWLVGEKLAEYKRLEQVKSAIDQQVREAEETVSRPSPVYPEEYQAILARRAELEPHINQLKQITILHFSVLTLI